MEKITDIWNSIKERFSSPLFFSFAFAWIFFNWEIVVALLWYDTTQLKPSRDIFEFIEDKNNNLNSLIYPLLSAVLYTLLNPVIKNLIRMFYTKIDTWGERENSKIAKSSIVRFDKYLELKTELDKREQMLSASLNEESEREKEVAHLREQVKQAQIALKTGEETIKRTHSFSDKLNQIGNLNGGWYLRFYDTEGKETLVQRIEIKFGEVRINENPKTAYRIENYYHNANNGHVFFTKRNVETGGLLSVNLDYELGNLVGSESGQRVMYESVSKESSAALAPIPR